MSSRPFSFLALLFSLALTYTPGVRLAADETPPDSVRGVVHLFPDSPRFRRHFSIRLEARTGCLSPIVADLDGDGTAALMTMTSEGTLEDPARRLATATDGRPHARDPVLGSNPLVGDVDGGGGEEIVSLNVGTRLWEITAPDETGEIRTTATDCSANQLGENVVLGDWDGDGRDELGVVRAAGEWTVASIRAPGCPTRPVPIWPLPNLRPIGVGDFAGDGHAQPVFSNVERDSWFVVDLHGARPTAPRAAWAELQGIAVDSAAAVGDFTGDGRSDLVIWSGSTLYGWWLAASIGETAIELPITGLPNLDGRPLRRLVGVRDLTGDGVDDLLLQHEDCETTVYSLEPGDPLPGVSVSGDAASVQTGTDGTFEFAAGSLGPLAAIKAGYLVLPRHVQPRVPSGAIARFVAFDEAADRASHSPLTLSGATLGPFTCTGYHPGVSEKKWGRVHSDCPDGYAVMELDEPPPRGRHFVAPYVVEATCCRLPRGDILTGDVVDVEGSCPEGFVATGAPRFQAGRHATPPRVRCSRLNQLRYRLGPEGSGAYWGGGLSMRGAAEVLSRADLPPGLREGVGRRAYLRWDVDGCTARSPGALLVGVRGPGCGGVIFRELFQLGVGPASTPVDMFPRCASRTNPYEPLRGCSSRDP